MSESNGTAAQHVGIDIGGTFTDIVRLNSDGEISIDKVPSSPDPNVLVEALDKIGAEPGALRFLGLGTTVGTNALIERKGPPSVLITTRGFRDLLEIRRADREDVYDLQWDLPTPLIPRYNRLEITERVDWRGNVITPLAEDEVDYLVRVIEKRGIESAAIVFLHSYANDENERRLAEILADRCPGLEISTSARMMRMYREFERTSTVATNAYLAPVMRSYFSRLRNVADEHGFDQPIHVMQSNGGLASLEQATQFPARLVRSGPSAGCVALEELARRVGEDNLIGLDIGGTSADVSLVRDGNAQLSDRNVPEWGLPVVLPSLDIISIGAGGGSIAHLDSAGSLKVGPESAGSDPGPACYRRGGQEPTSTDAQVALGRISHNLVGGDFEIDSKLAEDVIAEKVAKPLGLGVVESAAGIIRIMTENMMSAVRLVTVERGHDPRDFAVCAFGGNGAMYAVEIARALSIPRVVIPAHPGVFSAYGVLRSDVVYDDTQTLLMPIAGDEGPKLTSRLAELRANVVDQFAEDGIDEEDVTFKATAELRYAAQLHELSVDLESLELDEAGLNRVIESFHEGHRQTFGHAEPDGEVVLVNLRVFGSRLMGPEIPARPEKVEEKEPETRQVYFDDHGWVDTEVRNRKALVEGDLIEGPAILLQTDTTIVLPPGASATPNSSGDLIVEVGK